MRQFKAEAFFAFANSIGGARGLFEGIQTGAEAPGPPIPASDVKLPKYWRSVLLEIHENLGSDICERLDLPVSADMCKQIIRSLRTRKDQPIGDIEKQTRELASRMEVELAAHVFLYVNRETGRFYSEPFRNWDKTCAAYPGAMYDIEEGSKALALQRNTACVFHMMRVLERGLQSVATGLGLTLNLRDRNWGAILKQIGQELENRTKQNDPRWKRDRSFFEAACASLFAVKNAWRNTTMHVENVYDQEGAEHIYRVVRAFMEQLSIKLKE